MLKYYTLFPGSAILPVFANVISGILLALKSITIFEPRSVSVNLVPPLIYFLKSISQFLNSFNISHVFYSIYCLWNLFCQAQAIAYDKGNLKCSESTYQREDTKALASEWIKLQVAAFNSSPVHFSCSSSPLLNLMHTHTIFLHFLSVGSQHSKQSNISWLMRTYYSDKELWHHSNKMWHTIQVATSWWQLLSSQSFDVTEITVWNVFSGVLTLT